MSAIKEWYGAYNVIFNWFKENYGKKALEEYWKFIANSCYDETIEKFKNEGLDGIKEYFEDIFDKDGGKYNSNLKDNKLVFEVVDCPAYSFMKNSDNPYFEPIEEYCEHHQVINSILAKKSGHKFEMVECDNNGHCKWVFKNEASKSSK